MAGNCGHIFKFSVADCMKPVTSKPTIVPTGAEKTGGGTTGGMSGATIVVIAVPGPTGMTVPGFGGLAVPPFASACDAPTATQAKKPNKNLETPIVFGELIFFNFELSGLCGCFIVNPFSIAFSDASIEHQPRVDRPIIRSHPNEIGSYMPKKTVTIFGRCIEK